MLQPYFGMGLLLLALLAAAGCASAPPVPEVSVVKVPVEVPCKTPAITRPAFAVDNVPLGLSVFEQMKALRAERLQRKAYELELEAALRACQ